MDVFFNGSSVADRGTVAQLKSFFQHRSLKPKVMDNFQHVWDFLEVCMTNIDIYKYIYIYV